MQFIESSNHKHSKYHKLRNIINWKIKYLILLQFKVYLCGAWNIPIYLKKIDLKDGNKNNNSNDDNDYKEVSKISSSLASESLSRFFVN